jgi:hypothetical protein
MARNVYFSFHYEADSWRTNQVRNSWVTRGNGEAGFRDAADFEEIKKGGEPAISRWINRNLEGTSVTVVCVGEHTCERYWVREEIKRSIERGNGIIFIKIHDLKDNEQNACPEGGMDFGEDIDVSNYPVYNWKKDNGYENIGDWVEASAQAANRPDLGPPPHRSSGRTGCGRS